MPEATPLPRSVRQQADKANELMQQLVAGPPAPGSGSPASPATPGQPAAAAPSGGPTGEPPPSAPARPEDTVDYWKHRFSVLQGKYNSEVPVMQQQLRELQERMGAMTQPPPATPAASISEEERTEYGEDFFDVVKRYVLDIMTPVINQHIQAALSQVTGRVDTVMQRTEQTEEARFFERLSQLVPSWHAINTEPGWLTWLDGFDDFTGATRQALLTDAQNKLDAKRVAALFNAYLQTKSAGPAPVLGQPQLRMGDFADPTSVRASAGTPAPAVGGQIWTPASVNKFYSDVRRGVYVGRETEKRQIEQDIQRAGAEGRYQRA